MKTLTKSLVNRSLSVLLVLMMVFSLLAVGLTSASAAEVEIAETGASVTYAVGDYIYMKNFTPSGWSASWFYGDVYEWAHLFNSSTNASIDIKFELVEGTENAASAVYGAKITTAGTYTHVVFTRSHSETDPWNNCNQTGDIPLDATNNCYTNVVVGGTTYTGSVYDGGGSGGTTTDASFWVDLDGDSTTTYDIIYPDVSGTTYTIYLPSSVQYNSDGVKFPVTFYVSEGLSLTIGGANVASTGSTYNFQEGTYSLGGSFSGSLRIMKSENVSSIHTTTNVDVPQGTYQGYEHKDDFETKGSIVVIGADGEQKNEDTVLKKIKGRGNSSWEASHKIIGKYAFNITLEKKAKLLDESAKSKKYCLVSYNADEARMRNMIVYELAQQIGVNFAPDYETVDLYNNGYYIGTYLLTDKVEIGDPLVDIVNLDDVNEELNATYDAEGEIIGGTNFDIYEADDISSYRGSSNGSLSDTSTKGYYKYVNLEECDPSEYADSGFLLEFELNERFDDEISGFISTKGQQIVCKYPEFATKNEIKFIMDKWNTAEALMYDEDATYEELDAVIDVESFAKMYLIQELTKNLDGGATSYYVYYDGGKLHAGVAWDYDWTLGQYAKEYTDRVNSGSDFYDKVDADPSEEGGWYLNSKNIYGASTLNAQAALCQNDAFWGVVTAEWNEIFYSEALKFTDSTVSSVSDLDGILLDFYNTVKATTEMDEAKWGLIASDPFITNNWGSTDTGDNHNAAVVWLNNWMYNRLVWMDKYLNPNNANYPNSAPYNVDYDIQPPMVTVDKASYQMGETVTLTIDDKTDGTYTYTIYKDGEEVGTTESDTYTFTAENKGTANYTVKATSITSGKASDASDAAAVNVEGFNFAIDVTAPETATVGEEIVITATSNSDETVTYTLYNTTTGENVLVGTNDTGSFSDSATEEGSYSYTLEASTTVDGDVLTATYDFTVEVTPFQFSVTLNAPLEVEAGLDLTLSATTNSNATVAYTFKDGNGNIVATNNNGIYKVPVEADEIGNTYTYYVEATTNVAGKEYNATSELKTITVTAVKDAYDVTVYFKSTSTLGYKPLITTIGAVDDFTDKEMTKDIFIGKNPSQTASYYWYKAEVKVSKASPALSISVLSSRYAMESSISLNITETGTIYLAVDDLNAGNKMENLTDWDEADRNWCESALHMVYDETLDGEDKLASVSANFVMRYVGDANGDGDVNIKDATLIQKSVANITTLDDTAAIVSDVTNDGFVTIKDATAIQKQLVNL